MLLLATGLAQAGVDTVVVTGSGTELARRLHAAGVNVEEVPWSMGLDPRVGIQLAGLLAPQTIVHAHDSHAHALADAAIRLRSRPLVVTRRVTYPIRSPKRFRRADAVIAISRAVRDEVLRTGVDPGRVHVIPDAVDPAPANPAMAEPPAPVRRIVCIAVLTHEKGVDTLLEAASLLRAVDATARWLVVGEGPERNALERRRHALALDDTVEFAPVATTPYDALSTATLAVQPSRSEGLGSAVLQALALGVPVVAARTGGLPDALEHGGGMLVAPDSPAELCDAVKRLLHDDAARQVLGEQGRIAARWFTLELLVKRTIDVYRSLNDSAG